MWKYSRQDPDKSLIWAEEERWWDELLFRHLFSLTPLHPSCECRRRSAPDCWISSLTHLSISLCWSVWQTEAQKEVETHHVFIKEVYDAYVISWKLHGEKKSAAGTPPSPKNVHLFFLQVGGCFRVNCTVLGELFNTFGNLSFVCDLTYEHVFSSCRPFRKLTWQTTQYCRSRGLKFPLSSLLWAIVFIF